MAIESWRFGRTYTRILTKLDAGEQLRFINRARWFIKQIEDALKVAEMRIVDDERQHFDPGMAATPVNIEEFDTIDALVVDQMLGRFVRKEHWAFQHFDSFQSGSID